LTCAVVLCALLPLAVPGSSALASGAQAAPSNRPNILLIISDDQAWSTFSRGLMPSVYSKLVDQGVLFKRAYVNTSLCCPSRSQILTGLYEHDTGVDSNEVSLTRPTLPQALHDQGYRTMLAGKYLNSWPCDPRPEFDRWACTAAPELSSLSLVDPRVNLDGAWQTMTGYEPDILANLASNFIQQTPSDQPFFVMYAPTTPHLPADDPRYDYMPVTPPRGPAFDVNTMTQNTPRYARRSALTPDEIATSDAHYTSMAHATRSFDDAVGSLLGSLGDRSRDTLVVYLSDNGYLYGEHRRMGKNDPWEESVNVPMIVRYPAVLPTDQAFTSDALVQNVDIAATIADVIHLPWGADGQSFLPVLQRKRPTVRTAALIESCRGASMGSLDCSGLEYDGGRVKTPGFEGIVTPRYKYVEYDDGSVQLVDLKKDPHELRNLAGDRRMAVLQRGLAARLHAMMTPRLQTTIATGPGPSIGARTAEFSFFSPSRFATYSCRLVSDVATKPWHSCPGGFDAINNLPDGRYVFQVAGITERGRVDPTPASRAFTVASSGPDVVLDTHPASSKSVASASFTYSSTFPGAGFQCRLVPLSVGAAWVAWGPCDPAGTSFSELQPGEYQFEVRARDPLTDQVSDPAAGWFFRVDQAGPVMAFASGPPPASRRDDATFLFEPEELTVGPIRCTVDGNTVGCRNGRVALAHIASGTHTLEVTATDTAGNVGVTTYTWAVDRTRPDVLIASGPRSNSSDPVSLFNLWSSVDPALFVCSLDGSAEMPCFGAPAFYALSNGHHSLVAWSYDPAGNRSLPAHYGWTVDTTAPTDPPTP
jgi:N-acetylglucosamine-6-sulfatase